MMTLYIKVGCPYGMKVQKTVKELGLEVEEKRISDEGVWEEVMEKGGKHQVPFLIDEEHDIAMYDSSDIVKYLCREHGGDFEALDYHVDHHVCPVD